MRIDRWIRLGVLSLAITGNSVTAAEVERWRPSPQGFPAGMPIAPMPPAMLPGFSDPRFRPVPRANFLRPPPPPAPIYPGRPFVSVQGQPVPLPAGAPAFAKQYAWRPADRPMEFAPRRQESVMRQYPVAAQTPFVSPYPIGPGGHYLSAYGHPAPMGMLPPPPPPYPLPYPGMPFNGPGMLPPAPYLGASGFNPTGYQSYGVWPSQPYLGQPPVALPSYTTPWVAPWGGVPTWSRPQNSYSSLRTEAPAVGGFASAYPLAGLY